MTRWLFPAPRLLPLLPPQCGGGGAGQHGHTDRLRHPCPPLHAAVAWTWPPHAKNDCSLTNPLEECLHLQGREEALSAEEEQTLRHEVCAKGRQGRDVGGSPTQHSQGQRGSASGCNWACEHGPHGSDPGSRWRSPAGLLDDCRGARMTTSEGPLWARPLAGGRTPYWGREGGLAWGGAPCGTQGLRGSRCWSSPVGTLRHPNQGAASTHLSRGLGPETAGGRLGCVAVQRWGGGLRWGQEGPMHLGAGPGPGLFAPCQWVVVSEAHQAIWTHSEEWKPFSRRSVRLRGQLMGRSSRSRAGSGLWRGSHGDSARTRGTQPPWGAWCGRERG